MGNWGGWSGHLHVVAPGNRSCACLFFRIVSVKWRYLLATLYSDGCLSFCLPDVMVVCQPNREERAKCQTTTLGVIVRYSPLMCKSPRFRGRFPWWGGLRTPRYHGPLGCLPKSAGRPMGPATLSPETLLGLCSPCVCPFGFGECLFVGFRFRLEGCIMYGILCPSGPDSLFVLMFGSPSFFVVWDFRHRCFFFFSLSGAGEMQALQRFVFPLVFLPRGHKHAPATRTSSPTPT